MLTSRVTLDEVMNLTKRIESKLREFIALKYRKFGISQRELKGRTAMTGP